MTTERTLTTERLVLQPLDTAHAPDLFHVFSHPEAMRFMDTPPHASVDNTRTKLAEMAAEPACYWAVCLLETGRAVGFVGYLGNPGVPGMGYMLHPDYWRQGYMTEAAQAALAYGFTRLGLDRVELWINDDNVASQQLARALGFARRGQFRMKYAHQAHAHDKLVFGLHQHEWQSRPTGAYPGPQPFYRLEPVLPVTDVKETAEFYRDRLEFHIDFFYGDPPTHGSVSNCEWTTEGVRIQLTQASETSSAPLSFPPGLSLYLFVGPDIDERYARYRARGVEVVQEIDTRPWGMREFEIADCNGFVLRFGTPV